MIKVPKERTAHEKAIIEILDSIKTMTIDRTQVVNIFHSAGIIIDDELSLVSLADNAETCVNDLTDKLSPLPLLRFTARCSLRNRGLIGLIHNPHERALCIQ